MNVTLVSTSDDRETAICEHLMDLVYKFGVVERTMAGHYVRSLTLGPWTINHWLPCEVISVDQAASPGYRNALERQRSPADLPHSIDVWRGLKVLSAVWSERGEFKIITFVRGAWEAEALALQGPATSENLVGGDGLEPPTSTV